MIVVFDSGIWISALQFGGIPLKAIAHALTENRVLFCDQFEDEIVNIMGRKFGRPEPHVKGLLTGFLEEAHRVEVPGLLSGVCRDPKDDFVLECAVAGNADRVVTGDKDLLSLRTFRDIKIVTARQYLDGASEL